MNKKAVIMKSHYILILLILFCCVFSCKRQDEIYKEYVVANGIKYTQKADSLKVRPGYNRLLLSWPASVDPSVTRAQIILNNGQEVKDVDLTGITDTVFVVLDNLEEDNYDILVYTFDSNGNRSVPSEAVGTPYGERYLSSCIGRQIKSAVMVTAEMAELNWGSKTADLAYTEIYYRSTDGSYKTILVNPDESKTVIEDYDNTEYLTLRSAFLPKGGLDEAIAEWEAESSFLPVEMITFPKSTWQKLCLPGDTWGSYAGLAPYVIENLWNGNLTGDGYGCWASSFVMTREMSFTIDLGYAIVLRHLQMHNRNLEAYRDNGVRRFKVYGSMEPASDGSWDSWSLLGEFEAPKPSGYNEDGSVGAITDADVDYFMWHNEYALEPTETIPNPYQPCKYIRFLLLDNFGTWGKPDSAIANNFYVIGEVTLSGQFVSIEDREKYTQ